MKYNKRAVGAEYERMAGIFLEQQGFQILEYNYRCNKGEIDLIAMEKEYLVFCEVKYRKDSRKGFPEEAVSIRKQRVISQCAAYYLMEKGYTAVPCRFDVISIMGDEMHLVRNAFDYVGR